ncbi:winged helix-turn-helix transcriptional regulator [Schlesneria paludicola]|uniref:winged helix-turn-helix transcriptional regulator n=1 Tax=Schlesneria paludicola TaxID=360056 RepID=UPI00029A0994|nr:helix-turn-helix domain-containing protein [Schlesneria paludicola]
MKRKSMEGAECPVARSLDLIGDWWTLLLVRDAFDGIRRFSEFQHSLGISKGILAARLRALQEAGILQPVEPEDGGAYREYVLTPKGRDLFNVIVSLRQWGEAHCFQPDEAHSVLVEKSSGEPVGPLTLRNARGRSLDASATEVRKVGD